MSDERPTGLPGRLVRSVRKHGLLGSLRTGAALATVGVLL
jgi:hypothetical protein